MDDFPVTEEKVTGFLRAVQAPNVATLQHGTRKATADVCASLLAVSHPHALAVAALGDSIFAVRLSRAKTFDKEVTAALPAPALAVLCPPANPGVVVVLLDAQPASTAIRVFDLHALAEREVLEEMPGYHLYAGDDEKASVVSIQVVDMGWAGKSSELYLSVAFDNGNAGVYRLGGAESAMSSLKIHAGSASAAPGNGATCIAVVPRDDVVGSSAVAVGTEQGRVLLYSVTDSGVVKHTGTFSELISGWAPRYLYALSGDDILVVYKNGEDDIRNVVISVDERGLLSTDNPSSATHLGELCWPSFDAPAGLPLVMAVPIPTWPMSVVAVSKSVDVELLGRTRKGEVGENPDSDEVGEGWRIWKPDEGQCMVMPGDGDDLETFPIGIALNLVNTDPVPAANEKEAALKPMPRVLVLSSIGTLMEYTVADDRPKATCSAIEKEIPLCAPTARVLSNATETATPLSTSSTPARGLRDKPVVSLGQHDPAAPSLQATSRVRQRSSSVGSRSEAEVTASSSGDSADDEDSLDDSVSPPAHVQSLGGVGFGTNDTNDDSDTGNRESSSNDYDGEVDTDDENTGQSGFPAGRGGLRMDESRGGRPRVVPPAPLVCSEQFEPTSLSPSPANPPAALLSMEKRMKSNLTPAIQAARDPDPIAQLRSALLEMQEEISAVSHVSEGLQHVLEGARGKIASELDNVSMRIMELRSSISSSVNEQELRHSVASLCMKDAISLGRDLEAVTLLFRTNGGKNLQHLQSLGSDAVRFDERLDQKQSEVTRALTSIEEKLERPLRNTRKILGGRDVRRSEAGAFGDPVDTCQQIFSSLSLQGARIKRVLAMLGAMESQYDDHRRLLRGRNGSDIGLSQARLEKLSLSDPQQSVRPNGESARSTIRGIAESTVSKATTGMSRVASALKHCEQGPASVGGRNPLSADACCALRDIAMRGGRERIRVQACSGASHGPGDAGAAPSGNSLLASANGFSSSAHYDLSGNAGSVIPRTLSSTIPPVPGANLSARRGSGGTFTSTHLVRSGGQAYVGESESQQMGQSRGNTRVRSRDPNPSFGTSSGSVPRASRRQTVEGAEVGAEGVKVEADFDVQSSASGSLGQSKPSRGFGFGSPESAPSFVDTTASKEVAGSFSFGGFAKTEKTASPFAVSSAGSKPPQWGHSGAKSAVGASFSRPSKPDQTDEVAPITSFGTGIKAVEAAGKSAAPFAPSMPSVNVKSAVNSFPESAEISSATRAALPPIGSENDALSSTPKLVSKPDLASQDPPLSASSPGRVGVPSAPFSASGSKMDGVPITQSLAVHSKSVAFPSAALPPSGSEKDAVPTAALLPTVAETDAVPSAALPPCGSENDSVPKPKISASITVSKKVAASAALPPDGSENDVVPDTPLVKKSGSENAASQKASLPPAGSENDAVPAPQTGLASAKSSLPFGTAPSSVQEEDKHPNFALSSLPAEEPDKAAGAMPSDGSANDGIVPFGTAQAIQDSSSTGFGALSFNKESGPGLSLSALNFGAQAAVASADTSGEKSSLGLTSSLFGGAKALGETATAEASSSGVNFDSLGLGNSTTSSTTGGGGVFAASAPAPNSANSGAVVAFGGPAALGQSSETPVKLSPSPFASTSLDKSSSSNPLGFATSFSSAPSSFGDIVAPAKGGGVPTAPTLSTTASGAGFQSSSSSGFGASAAFAAASATTAQFGTPSAFGVSAQQPQAPAASAPFGSSSVPTASFGAGSGFGASAQSASTFGNALQPTAPFGGAAQPANTFGETSTFGISKSVAMNSSTFGQPSAFGQPTATTASTPSMGGGGFGSAVTAFQPQGFPGAAASPPGLFGAAAAGTSTGFAAIASQSTSTFGSAPFGTASPAGAGGGFGGAAPSMGGFGTPQAAPQSGGFGQSGFGQQSPGTGGFGQQASPASDSAFTSPAFTQRRG